MFATSNAELISRFITLILFILVGFATSGKLHSPRSFLTWSILVIATLLSFTVGTHIEVVGIDFAGLYLNDLLAGSGIGLIIGFLSKKQTTSSSASGT